MRYSPDESGIVPGLISVAALALAASSAGTGPRSCTSVPCLRGPRWVQSARGVLAVA